MHRTGSLILSVTACCLTLTLGMPTHAHTAAAIPDYFFGEWTITKDCSEQHAGPQGHVEKDLKFRVSRSSSKDGQTYALDAIKVDQAEWPGNWDKLKLEYRAGTKMTTVPADFECIPGEENSSPFLAAAGYSQAAEPWYEHEHWYGSITIHGELHHVLIFPRDVRGNSSAIIVLQDADASDNIRLDHNGSIHSHN